MRTRFRRKLWLVALAAGVTLPAATCATSNTTTALNDLIASTSGSLVQILVKAILENGTQASNPDLNAPLADQTH